MNNRFLLNHFVDEYIPWADATFPEGTAESGAAHLRKELGELLAAEGNDAVCEEAADCLMLLLFIAHKKGMNVAWLVYEANKKFDINKARIWGDKNADGFREHVKAVSS